MSGYKRVWFLFIFMQLLEAALRGVLRFSSSFLDSALKMLKRWLLLYAFVRVTRVPCIKLPAKFEYKFVFFLRGRSNLHLCTGATHLTWMAEGPLFSFFRS